MNYYSYIDELPPISPELIDEALSIRKNSVSKFVDPNFATYQIFPLGGRIADFTRSIFNFEHTVSLQVVKNGIPVHVDIGRKIAYNYLIDTGGDNVLTSYFNIEDFNQTRDPHLRLRPKKDLPPAVPLYSVCLEQARWHALDVSIPHSVLNIERDRVAITVAPVKKD